MSSERIHPETVEFDVRTDEMLISMGPQHPSTHGVLRVVLRTDGELVTEATPHIGYLHRCAEKIADLEQNVQLNVATLAQLEEALTDSSNEQANLSDGDAQQLAASRDDYIREYIS